MIIRHALTAVAVLIPSIAFSQMPGDTFGGSGGSVTGTGRVDAVAGDQAGQDISSTGTVNVVIDLIPTAVSPGQCTNCDLTVDTNGRITQKSDGTAGSGSGATTETSGVVHPTPVVAGQFVEDFAVGGTDATAQFFFDAALGTLTLNQPGGGINVQPHSVNGASLVLSEGADEPGGNVFQLTVNNNPGLTSNVTCEINQLGQLDAACPLIDLLSPGGATDINSLTDVDTVTVGPQAAEVLTWDGLQWEPAAASGGATNLNGLSDVDTASIAPVDTEVLTWVSANNKWEPAPNLGGLELSGSAAAAAPPKARTSEARFELITIRAKNSQYENSGFFPDGSGSGHCSAHGACYLPFKTNWAYGSIFRLWNLPDGSNITDCDANGTSANAEADCERIFQLKPAAGTPVGNATQVRIDMDMTDATQGVCQVDLYQDNLNTVGATSPLISLTQTAGLGAVSGTVTVDVCDNSSGTCATAYSDTDVSKFGLYSYSNCDIHSAGGGGTANTEWDGNIYITVTEL